MKTILSLTSVAVSLTFSSLSFANTPVEFQKIPEIMSQFEHAQLFVKKGITFGRLAHKKELQTPFPTYISDGKGSYILETQNIITDDIVIASMPKPIIDNVYNQWLVPKKSWLKTYGALPQSTEFKPFNRIKSIKAIKITEEMLTLLGSKDGKSATIKVSWNTNGMKVYKDGYLANYEYGIAPQEMAKSYQLFNN
ncbi:hypothetical protein C0W96_11510 [Photobacterium kishitanii]|uniref:hypothetical protein n=1 Tax=Photobacterium kishitanii TaxID=318456 RepID=UPI0005D3F7A6|nr:hypothetical protein [Photobacterium kishitanii]KJG11476.1 hypothetical protein UB40_02280 [Photobacterium kishitanii]PSV05902.1 hypothetical protein C0W96_11510 [Photobacterium kishitanii]PSV75788.1 hypothetical protein C0W29_10580 [Photobacterium kishitanii]